MALLNPTFLLGVLVVLYLSSFVLFAVIRILTGISIQRIGYLSLRRLAYTPKDGCTVTIRGLGLNVHRPTFAQPTWISLVLNELVVTVDFRELDGNKSTDSGDENDATASESDTAKRDEPKTRPQAKRTASSSSRTETWKKLSDVKERLKKLHSNVKWLRMIDVVATNSTIHIVDAGNIQVGSFTLAVDTRSKKVDRTRFFSQKSGSRKQGHQAEWIMTVRSVLFTAEGNEPMEVLDHALLNVHGYLYKSREGLRDATVALKLGRVHIPYDDIELCLSHYKSCRRESKAFDKDDTVDIPIQTPRQNTGEKSDGDFMHAASDSKEFGSSILRGIKEVQFAVGFIGVSKRVASIKPTANPILLNAAMKEVGIDLHRLDPNSPSHRMYFPSKDIAHEGLAAALSISVGLDDGHGKPERLLYIPMATTTVRTTLPSKTVEFTPEEGSLEEKNANILFANSVVTSPSVDLDPSHLPLLLALLQPQPSQAKARREPKRNLLSRMLPKASIKFSMHEPVMRIKLRPLEKTDDPHDFDLIISSISSIALDVESSHSPVEDLHYSLDGALRIQSHQLYYQTNAGERFNLITTDSTEMKVHLSASPDVSVDVNGVIQSFSISMLRPEITDGLRQIVRELRIDVEPEKRVKPKTPRQRNFLRSTPDWLSQYHIEAKDVNLEIAGVDEDISDDTRGVSLHLDSVSAEYRAHRLDPLQRRMARRRAHSRSVTQSDSDATPSSSPRHRRKVQTHGDGRRLSLHAKGIEAQIMEAPDRFEVEPFLSVPRLELAFSASSDNNGSMFHVQASVRTVMMQYSLYRHYAVGVAAMTLKKAFMKTSRDNPRSQQQGLYARANRLAPPGWGGSDSSTLAPELIIVDVKAALVQLKAEMPHDPLVMLRIYGLEAGRHRWSTPYMSSKLIRLYVQPPRMRSVWARMIGIKHGRLDLRESRHKSASGAMVEEKLIDISTEAIRMAVPHEVTVARINDNFINVIKAVQQLHHRFKTGTNEYILEKKPEGPKSVPKVSVRTRNFLFEIEDGAFEWKLGMIYRAGRMEQMQRLARDEAFEVKMKRVREEESRKGGSKVRSRSQFARGRTERSASSWFRSRSVDAYQTDERASRRGALPTYDPEGGNIPVSGNTKIPEEEARSHLHMFNAQSWKKRIDNAYKTSHDTVKELRNTFWGPNHLPDDVQETENILEVPARPALMSAMIADLHVVIDKPTFAMKDLPDFLHKVGKGMPRDMQYGLLIPMHVAISMNEARVTLRDYPLPLLHIPGLKSGQSSRQPSVSLKTNFVVAEEFRGVESTRRVRVNVVPPKSADPGVSNEGGFAIEVRRSIGPVKSYTDVSMDINTALPTRITWGPCYQPAVQDMMMAIESFTKPPIDPSERVGFWDKLRLNFHSRIHVAWKGDGDVHLALKGTRDPYQVTGNGAGFLMCWRNEVRWNINADDEPRRFMTVDSGEYVLAVPDYSHQVRESARRRHAEESHLTEDNLKSGTAFKKVVMKLSGKVQWLAGLVFEKEIEDGKRSFDFIPHYDVVLKNPHFAKATTNKPYDAFRGFRSRHIHLSIAVRAPVDREWQSQNPEPSRSYNTVHLTPRFFTHFFNWWRLFSQPMSLPIRQGNLFPGREKSSKKFGRHLATVKYSLLLAPLFLSHIYKHKDAEDYAENAVSATGLKVRFDSFMLDLHQRREEFNTLGKTKNSPSRTSGIKIHAGQLDLACADVRAVSASLQGTTTEAIKKGSISSLITDQDDKPDLSRFTIPDNDFSWIDMDDFVELDWILPTEAHPDTKILPLAYAPRLTYFRQTDIGGVIAGDPTRTSPFGDEPTHVCTMSHDDDNKKVQTQLIQERLDQLAVQMDTHSRSVGEAELRLVQAVDKNTEDMEDFEMLRRHTNVLQDKKAFLESMLEQVQSKLPLSKSQIFNQGDRRFSKSSENMAEQVLDIPPSAEFESEFNNRFVVHNMQLKWNNLLRNIVLRYIHQNSQRRGFVYYLSRPAIKFILDIVEEQTKAKSTKHAGHASSAHTATGTNSSPDPSDRQKARDSTDDLEDRIKNIFGEARKFSNANLDTNDDGSISGTLEDLESGISKEFSPQNSYHVRLIAPQIQLQSDKNRKHVVLVTAKGMELKVVEVMDKERISDTVSGLVQRRFLVNMDSTQFFVTHQKWFLTHLVSMYAGSRYGTPGGSAWPPWVPMEIMFDFQADPFGFKRVVQKTSAMLRYDKYNTLRLKYNEEVGSDDDDTSSQEIAEPRTDNLWVEFPQARALCNSSQYYAMYVIVLDLLMYSEPLEKTRSERLEKIMLASDFSDLSGAPKMVQKLQERIRHLEEIKMHFQVYSKYLDKRGWEERLHLERDLAACEDELFFLMKAITSSQRKYDANADSTALVKWSIAARDIVWHLMQDSNEPLVELQLRDVEYDRTDNSDGSHINLIRVGKVLGLNLLKDATYPEIITPYTEGDKSHAHECAEKDMIRVYWHMLESIAGIPVMDRFEVNLHPMKVQLEREAGKRLFEYIFPGMDDKKDSGTKNDSPFIVKSEFVGPDDEDTESMDGSSSRLGTPSTDKDSTFATRAGSLELRLRPTLSSVTNQESPKKALSVHSSESHHFRLFRSNTPKGLTKKASHESMKSNHLRPGPIPRSSTGFSSRDGRESSHGESKKSSRFGMRHRGQDDKQQSDDLSKMINRASNYMTFAHIKMPSVVLCLSYKGRDQRNFEDVHNFVFRLPTIEWQNKTWSNLDLALALKKAVMKALISHTGAIIGNKFSKHRPNAEQRSKLREKANSSVLIAPLNTGSQSTYAASINDSDDSSSMYGNSPIDYSRSPPQSRGSQHSGVPGMRSGSRSSSIASNLSHFTSGSAQAGQNVPAFMTMTTPPTPIEGSNRDGFGLGIDYMRPQSSGGGATTNASHRRMLRNIPSGDNRPSTSASNLESTPERRNKGPSGLRDRISAFTHRMSHRENSGQSQQSQQEDESESNEENGKSPRNNKRLSWSQSRTKTG
ncbi:Protein SABRE [Lecanicillium sp. MT-2017a]|nr:Protein SABRE [Lecanicillium sp. MT-2017a]